ncbi:hypothetical protein [Maricaulis sp. CAU 1757]
MSRLGVTILAALGGLACSVPVLAQPGGEPDGQGLSATPIINLRARAEQVSQDGLDDTTALTVRGRFGYDVALAASWSFLVEAEAVGHLNDDFSDTVETIPGKAVIADPEVFELNRLQLSWRGEAAHATLGRQRIILDDARFVGNVGFRQNEQTYDAVRFGYSGFSDVTLDYAYIDTVHRIFGDDSAIGEFDSDSHIVRLGLATGFGDFVATGLFLDFAESTALSGRTLAVGWSETWALDAGELRLNARLALQGEHNGRGPARELGYQAFGASLARGNLTFVGGVEILEGAGGTGFATPLATLHAFQGWADVFLSTPASGLRDASLGLKGGGIHLIDGAAPASWAVIYHDFDSDNGRLSYGSELDAVFRLPVNDWLTVEAKAALFNGDRNGPADRTKFWLALETSF